MTLREQELRVGASHARDRVVSLPHVHRLALLWGLAHRQIGVISTGDLSAALDHEGGDEQGRDDTEPKQEGVELFLVRERPVLKVLLLQVSLGGRSFLRGRQS